MGTVFPRLALDVAVSFTQVVPTPAYMRNSLGSHPSIQRRDPKEECTEGVGETGLRSTALNRLDFRLAEDQGVSMFTTHNWQTAALQGSLGAHMCLFPSGHPGGKTQVRVLGPHHCQWPAAQAPMLTGTNQRHLEERRPRHSPGQAAWKQMAEASRGAVQGLCMLSGL